MLTECFCANQRNCARRADGVDETAPVAYQAIIDFLGTVGLA